MQRFGSVVKVRPGMLDEYVRLHAAVWPEVVEVMKAGHVRNYTIFHRDGYLFSYCEYTGTDYAADAAMMDAAPIMKEWGTYCRPCQEPLETSPAGEYWASMEEIFHLD